MKPPSSKQSSATLTVFQVLREGEEMLAHSSASPRIDSEVLLRYVLNLSQTGLIVAFPESCPDTARHQFLECIVRRKAGEPIAYIVGTREFWGLSFQVTPDVLVPRPETELLVEQVLRESSGKKTVHILDLGTGSGCIAITLVSELLARGETQVTCDAVDVSDAALRVARENAQKHGVGEAIRFVSGSWCRDSNALRPPYDYIVTNPPYIDLDEVTPIELSFEPRTALYSEAHGLADVAEILRTGLPLLKPGGVLLCEVGAGKAPYIESVVGDLRREYSVSYLGDDSVHDRFRVIRIAHSIRP